MRNSRPACDNWRRLGSARVPAAGAGRQVASRARESAAALGARQPAGQPGNSNSKLARGHLGGESSLALELSEAEFNLANAANRPAKRRREILIDYPIGVFGSAMAAVALRSHFAGRQHKCASCQLVPQTLAAGLMRLKRTQSNDGNWRPAEARGRGPGAVLFK